MLLPINKTPLITSRDPESYVFSMLTQDKYEHLPFLLSHYISIVAYDNLEKHGIILGYNNNYEDYYHWQSGEIILDTFQVPNYAAYKGVSTAVAKKLINDGKYILGIWNEKYVAGKNAYRKNYMFGEFMLYGFDDKKSVFNSIGWIDNKYQEFEMPYHIFDEALFLDEPSQNMFWGARFCDITHGFDITNIAKELCDFIVADRNNSDSCASGWRALEFFAQKITTLSQDEISIIQRELIFLCEYAHLMSMRILYMIASNVIDSQLVYISSSIEAKIKRIIEEMNNLQYKTISKEIIKIAVEYKSLCEKILHCLEANNEVTF